MRRRHYENTTWSCYIYPMENKQEIKEMIRQMKQAIENFNRTLGMGFENYRSAQEFQKVCNPYNIRRLIEYIEETPNEVES